MRHVNVINHASRDLRFAIRQLLQHAGFAASAIAVLALGIAASVTIFGFVDAALVKPLPYAEPSRLVTVFGVRPDLATGQIRGGVSYLDFVDWRARSRGFTDIAAYDVRGGFTVIMPGGPEAVPGLRVTSGFFRTLGVTPVLGREFAAGDDGPSAPLTVILSYSAWQGRFGGRPDVLGQTVTLQSPWLEAAAPHVVIGVLPRDFSFPMAQSADLWTTIRGQQACWSVRSCRSLQTIARLAPDVSAQLATANTTQVLQQLRREYPDDHRSPEIAKLVPLRDVMLGDIRPVLLMLMGGAALLLLIACINVVCLLVAQSDSRAREIAVRLALGATRARVALQFATEALVLTAIGTALGLMLATTGIRFLLSLLSASMLSNMPYLQSTGLNLHLLTFAAAASVVAAVVFTLTPLVRMSLSQSLARLTDSSRGSAGRNWRRLGAHLVVTELAVAVLLLVGAGLLGKSLNRLLDVDLGFNAHGLLAVSVNPVSTRTSAAGAMPGTSDQPGALARRVMERVGALPGIESAAYADLLPLGAGLAPSSTFWIMGRPEEAQRQDGGPVRRISAGYFNTLQAALIRGRYFTDDEVSSIRPVIIINETAARRFFSDEDPIGRSIAFGGAASPAREIVGVVADIKDGPPETPRLPSAYVPFDQAGFGLVMRTSPENARLQSLAAAIHEVRPDMMVTGLTTLTERMNRLPSTSLHRSSAWLVGAFAATAIVLSVVGLYGVVAYSVAKRTREIGIRISLGAQRRSVYRMVVGEAAWLVGLGTVLGMIGAVTAATFMRHFLFGVRSWDPPTLITAAAVLIVPALIASYIPAHRAASVNPIDVLRIE